MQTTPAPAPLPAGLRPGLGRRQPARAAPRGRGGPSLGEQGADGGDGSTAAAGRWSRVTRLGHSPFAVCPLGAVPGLMSVRIGIGSRRISTSIVEPSAPANLATKPTNLTCARRKDPLDMTETYCTQ